MVDWLPPWLNYIWDPCMNSITLGNRQLHNQQKSQYLHLPCKRKAEDNNWQRAAMIISHSRNTWSLKLTFYIITAISLCQMLLCFLYRSRYVWDDGFHLHIHIHFPLIALPSVKKASSLKQGDKQAVTLSHVGSRDYSVSVSADKSPETWKKKKMYERGEKNEAPLSVQTLLPQRKESTVWPSGFRKHQAQPRVMLTSGKKMVFRVMENRWFKPRRISVANLISWETVTILWGDDFGWIETNTLSSNLTLEPLCTWCRNYNDNTSPIWNCSHPPTGNYAFYGNTVNA